MVSRKVRRSPSLLKVYYEQLAYVQPPPPLRKNRRRGSLSDFFSEGKGGGGGLSVLKITFLFFSLSLFIRKTLIHMLMQLNEAEYHLKNYGDRGGC